MSLQLIQEYNSDDEQETNIQNNRNARENENSGNKTINLDGITITELSSSFDDDDNFIESHDIKLDFLNQIRTTAGNLLYRFATNEGLINENDAPGTSKENTEISDMVLKNNIINACKHGPINPVQSIAFNKNRDNGGSTSKVVINDVIMDYDPKRCREVESSDSDDSEDESEDSSSDSDSDILSEWENLKDGNDESDSERNVLKITPNNKRTLIKAKGELGLEDLPPIQDLQISVPEQECEMVGTVHDIIDQLVIVESLPNKPSLDLDTVLFLENGKTALGHIFEVFGQVVRPFYCVRFNSQDHIKDKGIISGMNVYYAPKTNHTNFVFISELMKSKGSDASWEHDIEPPEQYVEFSDDEEERRQKKTAKNKRKERSDAESKDTTTDDEKVNQPTEYEARMNRRNLMKTVESNRNNRNHNRNANNYPTPPPRFLTNFFSRQSNFSLRPRGLWAPINNQYIQPSETFFNNVAHSGFNSQFSPSPPPVPMSMSVMNRPQSFYMRPARFTVPGYQYRHFTTPPPPPPPPPVGSFPSPWSAPSPAPPGT